MTKITDYYLYSVPGRDEYRFYGVCESPDYDGWYICWHTQCGVAHHPVKKLGKFETNEDANAALDKLAVEMGMKCWREYDKPLRSGIPGAWEKVR